MTSKQKEHAPLSAKKLLGVLRAAKAQQDLTAQPGKGRGIWLSPQLWQAVNKQLEHQVSEVDVLTQQLKQKEQELEKLRQQLEAQQVEHKRAMADMTTQINEPLTRLAALEAELKAKQEAWDKHKKDLEAQADHLLGLLHERQGLADDNDGLQRLLREAQTERANAERRAAEAEARAGELQRMADYAQGKAESGLTERDAQAMRVRELSAALADARLQLDTFRRQLAARSSPAEELTQDIKRLRADNGRLVALLAGVPEYRALAGEMAAECGVSYLPLEECLLARGLVEELHPQELDRPVEVIQGGVAGAGRRRDPDGPDPSLDIVLDEQYHWVPRRALQVGAQLLRRMMPGLPMAQLLALVAELNKVWRDRERQRLAEVAAAHREELRRLEAAWKQRAPYEAVVAGQKITDLKRQLRAQAAQAAAAAAAAKGEQRRAEDDSKVMLHAGLSSIQDLSRQVARLTARNKKLLGKLARAEARQRSAEEAGKAPALCSSCLNRLILSAPSDQPLYVAGGPPALQQPPAPGQPPGGTGGSYLTRDFRPSGSSIGASLTPPASVTVADRDWGRGATAAPSAQLAWSAQDNARPASSQPASDRPVSNHPARERPPSNRAAGDRPASARSAGERPTGERPVPGDVQASGLALPNYAHSQGDEQRWAQEWECAADESSYGVRGGAGAAKPDSATHGSASAAATEHYGTGPLVRVNVLSAPASELPAATLSVWRQRDTAAAAATAAATAAPVSAAVGNPTRHARTASLPPYGPAYSRRSGDGAGTFVNIGKAAPVVVHLQSALAGLTISTDAAAANATATGRSTGAGAGAAAGTSGASWYGNDISGRSGAGAQAGAGGGPTRLAVQVQLAGGSPCRSVLTTGPAASGTAATGDGAPQGPPAAPSLQQVLPVPMAFRFPRYDVAADPSAPP